MRVGEKLRFGFLPPGAGTGDVWPLYQLGVVLRCCGLTRGVLTHVRGDLAGAWRSNPASFVIVGAEVAVLLRAAVGFTTRKGSAGGRPRRWVFAAAALVLAALWVRQQANADLMSTS